MQTTAVPTPLDLHQLARQFHHPTVQAIVLMGSFARGDAGTYSDVDLVRFLASDGASPPGGGSHLHHGRLITVSHATPALVERWFTEPHLAIETIAGLRRARPLYDPGGTFAAIQQRAHTFTWDGPIGQKAAAAASEEMVGWIEEAHKGMEGLGRDDVGRLLNARHGFSWGLLKVMALHHRLLISGDNAFFNEVITAVGPESEWSRLSRLTFGLGPPAGLRRQVSAGLQLYALTAALLDDHLRPEEAPLVRQTAVTIRQFLADRPPETD